MANKKYSKDAGRMDHKQNNCKSNKGNRRRRTKKPADSKEYSQEEERQSKEGNSNQADYPNDPTYYYSADDKAVMEGFTRFSFPKVVGISHKWGPSSIALRTAERIRIHPSVGPIYDDMPSSSPINSASFDTYAKLSSINNKETKYAMNDVSLLVLSMGEILKMVSYIRKILRLTWMYSSKNSSIPVSYLVAAGVEPNDYQANITYYRNLFNLIITKINSIVFPANIPALVKASTMFDDVYRDSLTDYYTAFLTVPGSTWKLNDIKSEAGGGLDTVEVVPISGTKELSEYLVILEDMVDTMRSSATWAVIYSDLLTLQDRTNFKRISIPLIQEFELVNAVYNPIFNIMLRHATIVGENTSYECPIPDHGKNDVWTLPGTPYLTMDYEFVQSSDFALQPRIVNFYETNDPDMNIRIEMSRWMVSAQSVKYMDDPGETDTVRLRNCIVQDSYISDVTGYFGVEARTTFTSNVIPKSAPNWSAQLYNYINVANLPYMVVGTLSTTEHNVGKLTAMEPIIDLEAFSFLDYEWLKGVADFGYLKFFSTQNAW